MARAFRSIAQIPGLVANTRYVFISVDPYRDNPERLAGYVTYFSPAFIGVTGTAKQLYQLSDQIGLHFEYVDRTTEQPLQDVLHKPASDDYSIDHYSGFLLINPAGRLAATILPPLGAEQTLVIYQKIRNHYEVDMLLLIVCKV